MFVSKLGVCSQVWTNVKMFQVQTSYNRCKIHVGIGLTNSSDSDWCAVVTITFQDTQNLKLARLLLVCNADGGVGYLECDCLTTPHGFLGVGVDESEDVSVSCVLFENDRCAICEEICLNEAQTC
jgi:hypothetical protein